VRVGAYQDFWAVDREMAPSCKYNSAEMPKLKIEGHKL
jgi:hypothetical protein